MVHFRLSLSPKKTPPRQPTFVRAQESRACHFAIAARADAFALRDASEQGRALESWGGVLASCARENSAVRRVQ